MAMTGELEPRMRDDDDGVAEALEREREAELDPAARLSLEEFESGVARLRGR